MVNIKKTKKNFLNAKRSDAIFYKIMDFIEYEKARF